MLANAQGRCISDIMATMVRLSVNVNKIALLRNSRGGNLPDVLQAARDLRATGVEIITFGQYLQPTKKHLPVIEFVTPEKFVWFAREVKPMGFRQVVSGPLVRSSYHAEQAFATKI